MTLTLSSARPRERPSWRLRRPVLAAVGSHRPTEPTARRPERSVEPSAVHKAGCERECQPTLSCDTRSLRRFSRAETALLDRADRAHHRQQGARDDKSDKAACQPSASKGQPLPSATARRRPILRPRSRSVVLWRPEAHARAALALACSRGRTTSSSAASVWPARGVAWAALLGGPTPSP